VEAQIFYALSLLFAETPGDTSLANPRHAVAILNALLKRFPEHPGIAHYLIHACDNPQMADDGLAAARRYASIAPSAPHALHMPSHIYARLGLWDDDIRSNLASKAAAEVKSDPPIGAENRLHPMEFLVYAYLQTGRDEQAHALVVEAATVKASDVDPRVVENFYASAEARFPVLFCIETQDWTTAAQLVPLKDGLWFKQQPTLLAHAIAAGHLHDAQAGKAAAAAIDAIIPKIPALQPGAVAATMSDEIHAWADFSQGDVDAAIARLRPVADRQAKSGKGEVELPAREMLAAMELLANRPAEALKEYEASLHSDPNRFNGLLGAAHAAEKLGKMNVAAGYYRTLLKNCAETNGAALTALAHARDVVAQPPNAP
jgi:tetratricopeptide (TPR) repeat protein